MTEVETSRLDRIGALLADNGYEVTPQSDTLLRIREVDSGVVVRAALEGDVLFFSLVCMTMKMEDIAPALMRKMLSPASGIATSYFQLYDGAEGQVAVTLNNFCKLQDLGAEDEDDILSCVHFLLVDVITARDLLNGRAA